MKHSKKKLEPVPKKVKVFLTVYVMLVALAGIMILLTYS